MLSGEWVLVIAAAGGVGNAAVQIAKGTHTSKALSFQMKVTSLCSLPA